MIDKLFYILWGYTLLAMIVMAAYGWAIPFMGRLSLSEYPEKYLFFCLQIAAGIGIIILILFILGLLGFLKFAYILSVLGVGLGMALAKGIFNWESIIQQLHKITSCHSKLYILIGCAIFFVIILPLLLDPFKPPLNWDELSYHLPYARLWAQNGNLIVNEWLRYPLHAHNQHLLFTLALVIGNESLAHLIHAFSGALTVLLVVAFACVFMDWRVGLIAALLLINSTKWGWSLAYVDLTFMLFFTCSIASLAVSYRTEDHRFSYLAAFFFGITLGIKYLGLFYLPIFMALFFLVERRPSVIFKAFLILFITGGYWYIRNYIISGDPVHPGGGNVFGFWLWNQGDLIGQHGDFERVRGWRHWYLLLAFLAPLFWLKIDSFHRVLFIVAFLSVLLWYWFSGYWRYLVAIYPILALLAALVIVRIWDFIKLKPWFGLHFRNMNFFAPMAFFVLLLSIATSFNPRKISKAWDSIYQDMEERNSFLTTRFPGYALIKDAELSPDESIYQLGFENEIYLLGNQIVGDWFGPGRYTDVMVRWNDIEKLRQHLADFGVNYILVNRAREPFSSLEDLDLSGRFETVLKSQGAVLYKIKS